MLSQYSVSLGCTFCPTKGRVLDGPNFTDHENDLLREMVAESCDSYGTQPPPKENLVYEATVAIGDPGVAVAISQKGNIAPSDKPISCTACKWYVPANYVRDELGYLAPMCSAKGRLLFPRNLVREAANCGTGLNGDNRTSTVGIIIHAVYVKPEPVHVPTVEPVFVDNSIQASRHAVDPRAYPTDRPVSPEDEVECIRAWREVVDPEGLHESVYLPIFDGEKLYGFDPRTTYGGHRPDLFVDHAGILYDLACELLDHETPVLIGTAGTGKSEAGCYLAYLMDLTHTRIDIKKGTEAWHFIGEAKLETDSVTGTPVTKFHMGRFAEQYDKPGITTVNEPNLVADIFEFLRPVFDNADQLGLDEAQGIIVTRHSRRYILCTENPQWDPLYVGAEQVSAADIDRISPIYFELPNESVERQIITRHCNDVGYDIQPIILDKIMQVARDLRAMIVDGTLPIAWGLRAQIKVAKKTRRYSFEKAYRRAVIDGMEPQVVDAILTSVRSVA